MNDPIEAADEVAIEAAYQAVDDAYAVMNDAEYETYEAWRKLTAVLWEECPKRTDNRRSREGGFQQEAFVATMEWASFAWYLSRKRTAPEVDLFSALVDEVPNLEVDSQNVSKSLRDQIEDLADLVTEMMHSPNAPE